MVSKRGRPAGQPIVTQVSCQEGAGEQGVRVGVWLVWVNGSGWSWGDTRSAGRGTSCTGAGADEFRGAGGVLKGVAVTANRRQVVSHALLPLVV